ncbi:MAG: rhomboid family intramembrane serine protease [Acidobacteriota bacterium]|nr:rhomboid family intramembrane serine protease [Acidobacteriota bacterium]
MILPIGHEESGVRRLPWVSFAVMALCVIVFLTTTASGPDQYETAEEFEEVLYYWVEHPYLDFPPEIVQIFDDATGGEGEAMIAATRTMIPPPENREQIAEEQEHFDELCASALGSLDEHVFFKYGLVPAERKPVTFLTHMFLHAGWFHLLGNLLIFYLAGPFIEDVWGRPLFSGFYVVAGIFAAMIYIMRVPDSTIPMIGASGAISGVMGAFLIRYWHIRIKFFYIFAFFIRGTFDAPAWVMLPLWFAVQVFYAALTDSLGPGASGVAYWAHIGGFVFGVGVAYGIRHFQVEERYIKTAIDAKTVTHHVDNSALEGALDAHARGETDQALQSLAATVEAEPSNEEAIHAYWSIAVQCGRPETAAAALTRLIASELRTGREDLAVTHWTELSTQIPHPRAGGDLLVRLAQALHRQGRREEAVMALRRAMLEAGSGMTATMAMRIARAAREIDPSIARGAARLILTRPDPDPAERSYAEDLLRSLGGPGAS